MEKDIQPFRIDVKEVFRSKNPGLASVLPGFVFRYIKRIIHEDYINYFLEKHGHKQGADFARASIEEFNIDVAIKGEENIPKEGRYIFAANHPLGGFDGILLIDILSQRNLKVKYLVNDILMNMRNLEPVFLPINKHGGHSKEVAKKINEAFLSDEQILTFPSGYVSRKIKGKITDLPWRKNFITKAIEYKRNIIPVHFSGRNSSFFYNLANFRKFLRIKANLEMFYLVDETYKHRNKHICVSFGKEIPYTVFDKTLKYDEWAEKVRDHVYKISTDTNHPFET